MKTVLDPIFIRRPRLNYISPPICEVLFSSSAFPIIVLNPLNKKKGPTGLILGGRRGRITLRWDAFPGALCYNVYRADTIASIGPCACSDQYTLIGDCVSFPDDDGFEVNDFGCYVVTAILASEGETLFSDAICFNNGGPPVCPPGTTFDPVAFACNCNALPCPPGQSWDPNLCICATCPVQPCPPGFHWDQPSCSCVPDGGGCSGFQFVDNLGIVNGMNDSAAALGGYKGFANGTSQPWVYFDRISQSIDTIAPLHPGGAGETMLAGSGKMFFGTEGGDYFFLKASPPGIVAVTLFALGGGETLDNLSRMNPDGSFLYPSSQAEAHNRAHIYQPETNTWLNVGVTHPVQIDQSLWDMNASRVVTGSITDLAFEEKAVTITGGNTATDVPIPPEAPPIASRQTRGLRINNLGSVAGYWVGSGNFSPFVYIAGVGPFTIINCDLINSSLVDNTAIYITENNIVAGTVFDFDNNVYRGYIWTQGGGLTYLSAVGANSQVSGVNSSGIVVGFNGITTEPSIWKNGTWTTLSDLGMAALGWTGLSLPFPATANQLTDDGFIFGGGTFNGEPGHAFAAKLCP